MLGLPTADSIPDAITRLSDIQSSLSPKDGLTYFNRIYVDVTRDIYTKICTGYFHDSPFLTALDLTFVNRYLTMVFAANNDDSVPLAWRPLIESRSDDGIDPVQFALAAMNAHINYDLPNAVFETCVRLETAPKEHFDDYQKVDGILDSCEEGIRRSFESRAELDVDKRTSRIANLVADWTIKGFRDLAWNNALILWDLRSIRAPRSLFDESIGAAAALTSRLVLVKA